MDNPRTSWTERQFAMLVGAVRRGGYTDKEKQAALLCTRDELRVVQPDRLGATGPERMTKDRMWNRWNFLQNLRAQCDRSRHVPYVQLDCVLRFLPGRPPGTIANVRTLVLQLLREVRSPCGLGFLFDGGGLLEKSVEHYRVGICYLRRLTGREP